MGRVFTAELENREWKKLHESKLRGVESVWGGGIRMRLSWSLVVIEDLELITVPTPTLPLVL